MNPDTSFLMHYFNHISTNACSIRYPNLNKVLNNRIQTSQRKCIPVCLELDKVAHISHKEFETLNWLPVTERFNQCIIVFTYVNNQLIQLELKLLTMFPFFFIVILNFRFCTTISHHLHSNNGKN